MKKVLSATAVLFLLTGAAFAQDKTKSKTTTAVAKPAKSKPGGFICGTAMQQEKDSILKAKGKKSCCMQPSRTAGLRTAPKKAQ